MDDPRLLVALLSDRGALARLVRAALNHEIAHVPLAAPPRERGPHTLQLRVGDVHAVSLVAEPAGDRAGAGFPLRLRPLDPSHVAELSALAGDAPRSSPSPTLPDAGEAEDRTLPLPSTPPPPLPSSDDVKTAPGLPADASDPSLSVTIDFGDAPPAHPADEDGISVVFGDEPTTPGSQAPTAGRWARTAVDPPRIRVTTPTEPMSAAALTAPRTSKRTQADVGPGRMLGGKYRLESLIGAGAVGAVYRATHSELGRVVAVKVLHPEWRADPQLLAAFRAEARAASLLRHRNVTVVHDFGQEPDGLVYIVMEHLPGATLQTVIDGAGHVEPERAIAIMLQVCAALSAAHEHGIVHRDVKPENIMLVDARDDEGRPFELVKVCDFGIAALEAAGDEGDDELTAGTPEYMAPEQIAGRSDARTDVYACGVVLYEMLTGRVPYAGSSPISTLAKHATEMARPPSDLAPDVPPGLDAVVLRAIAKEPDARFASMRELRAALKRATVITKPY